MNKEREVFIISNQIGYSEIITPNLYNKELWIRSGHYDKYKENIYMIDDEMHN